MITLTYPGEFQSVCPDGRAVKRHLKAYRKRLERYLERFDSSYSCLWFLEFQERGAPHIHLLMWGMSGVNRDALRRWSSRAWAAIVKHENPAEYQKHLGAGSSIQKMRKKHFGYAAKYASKMRQKLVPADFSDVGRFWGYWNFERSEPVIFSLSLSYERYKQMGDKLAWHVFSVSKGRSVPFYNRLMRLWRPSVNGHGELINEPGFTVTVFGEGAKDVVLGYV
jgi:hypothetical protein